VGQNLAVGAASLPYGIYQGFGNPAAGEAAMSQFQQEYGYTPTNPAAQRQLQGLGEFLQQLETEYKIPPMISPSQLPSRAATAGSAMQLGRLGTSLAGQSGRLARELVREIQTTPPTGAVQLAPTPGLLEKSDIGFYSQLEAAVQPLQNKGTGQQYLAQIQKSAGVKPEEIQWTGLDEFLKSKQSVTKQEIQDYLQANRVDVQEVRLGENGPYTQWKQNLAQAQQSQEAAKVNMELTLPDNFADINYYNIRDMWAAPAAKGDPTALGKIRFLGLSPEQEANILDYGRQVNRVIELKKSQPTNTSTKFSQYTLPGGENYREILLTLPEDSIRVKNQLDALDAEAKRLSDAGDPRWREVSAQRGELLRQQSRDAYRSSHFDQPNILAHLRVNDRTVDGKKTLFIEEIQSDWHQAGRKKGYDTPEAKAAEQQKLDNILAERQGLLDEQRRLEELALPYTSQGKDAPSDIVDRWSAVSNRINNLQTEQNRLGRTFGQQVPDAPFKTTWHELSLKRAIQEASEKGYDQIAFTTGKTQAERYDLSQQIDEINVVGRTNAATGEQTKSVALDTTDGKSLRFGVNNQGIVDNVNDSSMSNFVGKGLDEVIGKDLAKKIMDGGSQTISGEGLKVGGEGMKGFYDNILPKSLDKLGKKFGAKVGKTEMDGVEVWQMDITPQMRESVVTKGQPLFAIPAIGAGLLGAEMMQEEEQF
jgi:hypothetical protein